MKRPHIVAPAFALTLTLALVTACSPPSGEGEGEGEGEVVEVTEDDVVAIDDVVLDESTDDEAAATLGDPATMLESARAQGGAIADHLRAALDLVKEAAVGQPDDRGTTETGGLPFARWYGVAGADDQVDVAFTVVRTAPNRYRYLLEGKPVGTGDEEFRALMTGIFIKRAAKKGGGRLHVSLTRLAELFPAVHHSGSVHAMFANFDEARRVRRVAYLNVVDLDDANALPLNYGADLIRKVGTGGRFRAVLVGADVVPELDGVEAVAMRVAWLAGQGGRADAVVAHVAPAPRFVIGRAHECWDADGLRTAYSDSFAANDAVDPDEGDTANCFTLAEETLPEDAASADGSDTDDEVDDVLAEADVDDITEEEADDADGV